LAPLLESKSRREPFGIVNDAGFNYKYFERSFAMKYEPFDRPGQIADGYDIKKMITAQIAFVDSRSHILIQTVDILTSFLRRILAGEIAGAEVWRTLGRLQIYKMQRKNEPQTLSLVTLSADWKPRRELVKSLEVMTKAARVMIKPRPNERRSAKLLRRDSSHQRQAFCKRV
jgi:hypothetical protein